MELGLQRRICISLLQIKAMLMGLILQDNIIPQIPLQIKYSGIQKAQHQEKYFWMLIYSYTIILLQAWMGQHQESIALKALIQHSMTATVEILHICHCQETQAKDSDMH